MLKQRLYLVAGVFAFAAIPLLQCDAWARGGGGGSGGGGIVSVILLPFLIIYSAIVTHLVQKKSKEAQALASKLARQDRAWDVESIKRRVQYTYFKFQEAWMERDLSRCRDLITDQFNIENQNKIDEMVEKHRKNIMEDIKFLDCKIVQVADFVDDNKDNIWVWIKGSMSDYIINDESLQVVKGDKKNRTFTELWRFQRLNDSWLLDEIHQTNISDLSSYHSLTHLPESNSTRVYAGRSM